MTIVVDANLAISTFFVQPYSAQSATKLAQWKRRGERLLAPALLEYEVTSTVRRTVWTGRLDQQSAVKVLRAILALEIELIQPDKELDQLALDFAERLGQSKAYDAQYLALASRENAAFWTADQRLAEAAQTTGLSWVHWIGA